MMCFFFAPLNYTKLFFCIIIYLPFLSPSCIGSDNINHNDFRRIK